MFNANKLWKDPENPLLGQINNPKPLELVNNKQE